MAEPLDIRGSAHQAVDAGVKEVHVHGAALADRLEFDVLIGVSAVALPDRMAVMGQGVGGYLALMVGTLRGDEAILEGSCGDPSIDSQVALVADYSGFPDLEGYAKNTPTPGRFIEYLGATYADDPELWRLASPINHVSPDDRAVVVIGQGGLDQESPIEPVNQFVKRLEESGVETHYLVIEGAGHTFFKNTTGGYVEIRRVVEPLMRSLLRP